MFYVSLLVQLRIAKVNTKTPTTFFSTYAKAVFIKARVFGEEFKVIKVDNSFPEYYARLSDLNAQFRRIGVNYNQVVRELKSRFSEKKAMALLYKLEETSRQLVAVSREIVALTQKFEREWLRTSM